MWRRVFEAKVNRLAGALAVTLALLVTAGCAEGEGEGRAGAAAADGRLRVVASIPPLASVAEQIVGQAGEVTVLLPPGRSPHGFELTANQVRMLAASDVLLVAGGGVDPWASRAVAQGAQAITVIDMHERMVEMFDLDEHDNTRGHDDHAQAHGPINPHHWLDPVRVRAFAEHLGARLSERDPAQGSVLQRNTESLLATIDQVHREHQQALTNVQHRELVTFHNAFDPLAARYDLRVIAHLTPVELTPGGEVTPRRLKAAVEAIERYDLAVVYAEPQFPEQVMAVLREQTGAAVLRLDPLGHAAQEGYQTWQAMMRSNLETLVDGQNRSR